MEQETAETPKQLTNFGDSLSNKAQLCLKLHNGSRSAEPHGQNTPQGLNPSP